MQGSGQVKVERMELTHFRHLWGVEEGYGTAFPKFRERGYTGVEALLYVPDERYLPTAGQRASFDRERERTGLEFIGLIWTLGGTVKEHLKSFREQYEANVDHGAVLVNSMGGRDIWSDDEVLRYYEEAQKLESTLGCPVTHEIHRSRPFYHPSRFMALIDRLPELKLCADFSHWTCACEGMLEESHEAIRRCAAQCWHLHTRVGHEEGPQVADPRAPEARRHLASHEEWWEMVWEAQVACGQERLTATPEFGPPPYMQTLPHTGEPVAPLEAICDWQKERQASHFREWWQRRS